MRAQPGPVKNLEAPGKRARENCTEPIITSASKENLSSSTTISQNLNDWCQQWLMRDPWVPDSCRQLHGHSKSDGTFWEHPACYPSGQRQLCRRSFMLVAHSQSSPGSSTSVLAAARCAEDQELLILFLLSNNISPVMCIYKYIYKPKCMSFVEFSKVDAGILIQDVSTSLLRNDGGLQREFRKKDGVSSREPNRDPLTPTERNLLSSEPRPKD